MTVVLPTPSLPRTITVYVVSAEIMSSPPMTTVSVRSSSSDATTCRDIEAALCERGSAQSSTTRRGWCLQLVRSASLSPLVPRTLNESPRLTTVPERVVKLRTRRSRPCCSASATVLVVVATSPLTFWWRSALDARVLVLDGLDDVVRLCGWRGMAKLSAASRRRIVQSSALTLTTLFTPTSSDLYQLLLRRSPKAAYPLRA